VNKLDEGFKIICLKCGEVTIITKDGPAIDYDNDSISIYPTGYDGEIGIGCDCGNKADEAPAY
jgi:hypothetical protein